jgi:hypothetical protein
MAAAAPGSVGSEVCSLQPAALIAPITWVAAAEASVVAQQS